MAQTRKLIFGSLVDTEDTPLVVSNIMAPGRLKGFEFEVAGADLLRITPGSCLLPDGIVIIEDASRSMTVSNSSFSADYTVIYQLEDSRVLGGSPAVLRLLPGLSRQEDFTDATIIGWIKYSGGSVPINDSMFVQPKSIRIEQVLGNLPRIFQNPFFEAVRPPGLMPGSQQTRSVRQTSMSTAFSNPLTFGGAPARILGATVFMDSVTVPASLTNYDNFRLRKTFIISGTTTSGSNIITAVSDTTRLASGQSISGAGVPSGANVVSFTSNTITISGLATSTNSGTQIQVTETLFSFTNQTTALTAATPTAMTRATIAPERFVIGPADILKVENTVTGAPPTGSGEISFVAEVPATPGIWQETTELISNEFTRRWLNVSQAVALYNMKIPFVITGEGQPRKLVSRLVVDFNAIVTFKISIGTTTLTLDPGSGAVSNTGGLVTREFNIPLTTSVDWIPGNTALIEVEINAQAGGSAAFAHISLTNDSAPFLLFI